MMRGCGEIKERVLGTARASNGCETIVRGCGKRVIGADALESPA